MDFGSGYAFVPGASKEEYELISETIYNHKAPTMGYASASNNNYKDDGEVECCPCWMHHTAL